MSEYDYNHDRDRHTEQGEGIIRKYERYMYGGRVPRDRIEENSPNATIEELDEDDIQILNLVGIDEKQELTPEDEREINQVFQAGIPTAIVGTYGTTLGTKVIWKSFAKVIIQRFGVVAAQALGLSAADGLLPVGEAVALGLLAVTAWQIYRNWDELWRDAEQILVGQEREPQVYTTPTDPEVETQRHTGHAPEKVETGTPGYETPQVETPRHTGSEVEKPVASDYVMESRWSSSYHYQKNAPQVNYKNQVHHLITDAESQQSDLALEAHERGLWNVDRTTNLIRLPSTKAAYQQSPIKIKHRGSHKEWSSHARQTLDNTEKFLELKYTTLDNVPDAVLEQALKDVEETLKQELQDINLGIQRGWIKIKPDGTQKLSRVKDEAEIA